MILLDTHVLVWLRTAPNRLSKSALSAVRRAERRNELAISVFTLYELAAMVERGRIRRQGSIEATVSAFAEGLILKPITLEIAALAVQFPPSFPRDPGDRIIAATARAENLPLITADRNIQASPLVRTIG